MKKSHTPFACFLPSTFLFRSQQCLVTLQWMLLCSFISTAFSLNAQIGLSDLAEPKKVYIGNIISNQHLDDPQNFREGKAEDHLSSEYNAVVLENYMKMSFVLPSEEPSDIHNMTVDQLRSILKSNKIEEFLSNPNWANLRKRGHAMIWFNQAPNWLNISGPTWTGQQVFSFTRKYILALGQICGDRVDEWDVINEAISDLAPNGQRIWRERTWYRRANDGSMTDWGEATYENYIKMLFVWARQAQPNARLHINDYSIELFNDSPASKNRFMRDQVKALKDCGAPIDGVGFQSHFVLSDMVDENGELNSGFIASIEQSIQDLATADLEVAITELDIRICNNNRDEALQEIAFQAYCEMAWSQPNCHEVLIWGLRDEDNWITLRNDGFFEGCQDAVIAEGDDYTPKAAYAGVAAAINSLPNQNEFGFAPLNQGDGASADCGGAGAIIPDILQVQGPRAVAPGDQVQVSVDYLASDDQDIVVWFQLDQTPFTVYSQVVVDVSAGSGKINVPLDIPQDVEPGTELYRYLAFISPDGLGYPDQFNETFQNRISVLGPGSQVVVSCSGPERVRQGDSVDVIVRYSAVQDQEIVVWFQLDQSPFTTYYEFRQKADIGLNELTARMIIPLSVPVAEDAYQYQSLLVPTGGSWPDRISSLSQPNVDVDMVSNTTNHMDGQLLFNVFPNPAQESCTINLPDGKMPSELIVYTIEGKSIHRQKIPKGMETVDLDLSAWPAGLYYIHVRQESSYGTLKLHKE